MSTTAFPFSPSDDSTIKPQLGMSLRDYFAAKALQGLLANANHGFRANTYVELSYDVADKMLEARQ